MTPGFLVQRRHPARPRAVAPMLPQELLRIAPYHVLDRAQKPPGVFLDVGLGVGALLERDMVLDDDAMMAVVGLAHDENRDHNGMRFLHQPRERARGRRRLAEKRDEDRLAALGVLIERTPTNRPSPSALSTARAAERLRTTSTPARSRTQVIRASPARKRCV